MTDITWEDLLRTGPGTLAGRYLRRFWQPVFRSKDLSPGQAAPIRIMNAVRVAPEALESYLGARRPG